MKPADAASYARISAKYAYVSVAASQTAQPLSATGAVGNVLAGLLITPAVTAPGAVSIIDGGNAPITIFDGGTASVADLKPFLVDLKGIVSQAGGWAVTTGVSVSAIAIGVFT